MSNMAELVHSAKCRPTSRCEFGADNWRHGVDWGYGKRQWLEKVGRLIGSLISVSANLSRQRLKERSISSPRVPRPDTRFHSPKNEVVPRRASRSFSAEGQRGVERRQSNKKPDA